MYYFSNKDMKDSDLFLPLITRNTLSGHAILPNYRLIAPFQLTFITFHPDDRDSYFLISMLAPDFVTHTSLGQKEIEPYLALKMHKHDFYEMMFVLEGSLFQKIETRRHFYETGCCCLLNHNVLHAEEYASGFRILFLEMSDGFLKDAFQNLSSNYFQVEKEHHATPLEEFLSRNLNADKNFEKNYIDLVPVKDNGWAIQNVHSLFDQISRELLSPHVGSSILIKGYFFKLLSLLSDPANYETTPISIGTPRENAIFNQITNFMEESHGRISRAELSGKLNYSGVYLNNITKKYTGLALFDYGMTFCMKKATEMLSDTSLSVTDISMALGFTNRNHFYKLFRHTYHMTPQEYRRKHQAP